MPSWKTLFPSYPFDFSVGSAARPGKIIADSEIGKTLPPPVFHAECQTGHPLAYRQLPEKEQSFMATRVAEPLFSKPGTNHPSRSNTFLRRTAIAWFTLAALGQMAFVLFIAGFYGSRTLSGNPAAWNDKPHITGYAAGDHLGNAAFLSHALLGGLFTVSGLVQMLPTVRRNHPRLHRWNGRLYMVSAYALALGGLWLTWGRGSYLSVISALSVSGNALLMIAFASLAWRSAITRSLGDHRRWAMRTFLVANGVWFFRVAIMAWVILNQSPVGMTRRLDGPADIGLQFGSYLLPLALLEAYFAAQRLQQNHLSAFVATLLLAATALTAVGIFGTIAGMWLPYL
jgi:hypothetical protein